MAQLFWEKTIVPGQLQTGLILLKSKKFWYSLTSTLGLSNSYRAPRLIVRFLDTRQSSWTNVPRYQVRISAAGVSWTAAEDTWPSSSEAIEFPVVASPGCAVRRLSYVDWPEGHR